MSTKMQITQVQINGDGNSIQVRDWSPEAITLLGDNEKVFFIPKSLAREVGTALLMVTEERTLGKCKVEDSVNAES